MFIPLLGTCWLNLEIPRQQLLTTSYCALGGGCGKRLCSSWVGPGRAKEVVGAALGEKKQLTLLWSNSSVSLFALDKLGKYGAFGADESRMHTPSPCHNIEADAGGVGSSVLTRERTWKLRSPFSNSSRLCLWEWGMSCTCIWCLFKLLHTRTCAWDCPEPDAEPCIWPCWRSWGSQGAHILSLSRPVWMATFSSRILTTLQHLVLCTSWVALDPTVHVTDKGVNQCLSLFQPLRNTTLPPKPLQS